ncbi:fibrobacter succinogenes major paralogous domain-containing protein [Hallerella succinigenes]|uniref:fibrobacter succinogenes major paralogous domain-containing protein n=1 Tax=Hallerella succinigenes TaxID=1896222 RepID=UPI002A7FF762|nr:fibrobacter succinogenes major paralogous domain-containing protein [Hallerella succinigenes]MDY5029093.1 fibrobacter succinogenes major paralogous domain-containing protein [Hallerella succinigenes]
MNFAKFSLGAFALTAMLVACDSDSASAKDTEIEELSSSSAVEIASSSSTIRDDSSSSSAMETSSSSAIEIASSSSTIRNDNSSSSSETTQSSSSTAAPCNVDGENNCNYGTLTDTRDGQTYKTVVIGEQTWMADNLNYETENSYCYDDDPSNCSKYGRLYTWVAATTVCPSGWHLPSTTEWKTLFTAVGGSSTAGTVLKSTGGWYNDGNGTYAFGFSALPAGLRNGTGGYYYEGDYAYFWSSTEYYSNYAYSMYLYYGYDFAGLDYYNKDFGRSVRCVKD